MIVLLGPRYSNRIPRVGRPLNASLTGPVYAGEEGIHEVGVDIIVPLHPVPRPDVPANHIETLQEKIRTNGYNLLEPIPVLVMPDGVVYSAGGHHRVEAMKRLGEGSIPARIYYWHSLGEATRVFYRQRFPLLTKYP